MGLNMLPHQVTAVPELTVIPALTSLANFSTAPASNVALAPFIVVGPLIKYVLEAAKVKAVLVPLIVT
jgi:hypothetical protein